MQRTLHRRSRNCQHKTPQGSIRVHEVSGSLSKLKYGAVQALILRAAGVASLFFFHTIVARYLGPKGYGVFSFSIATVSLLAVTLSGGWLSAITRFVAQYRELCKWELLRGVLARAHQITLFPCLLASFVLVVLSTFYIDSMNREIQVSLYFSAFVLPISALLTLRRMIFQGFHFIAESIMPEDIIVPIFGIAFIWFLSIHSTGDFLALYVAISAFALLLSSILLRTRIPSEAYRAKKKYATNQWVLTALPMLVSGICQIILNRTDVLLIGSIVGMNDAGLYSGASRIALCNVLLLNAVDISAAPLMASAYHSGRFSEFKKILKTGIIWSALGALPLFCIMMFFPTSLLRIFGPEFTQGSNLLKILAFGQYVNALTGPVGKALLMTNGERQFALSTGIAAILNFLGNIIAIPIWGATGAAVVTALTVILMNASQYIFVYRIRFEPKSGDYLVT